MGRWRLAVSLSTVRNDMPRPSRREPPDKAKLARIEPTSSASRASQVTRALLSAITSGQIGPELPNQHELAAQMGVSLATVRRAIDVLRAEGYMVTVPSVGTFVRATPAERGERPTVVLWRDDLDALAASPVRSLLADAGPSEAPARAVGLAGQQCWHWQWRLMGPELEPCAVVDAWATKELAHQAQRAASPFDLFLASRDRLARLDETVRTLPARPSERQVLSLEAGEGIMLVTSAGFGPDGSQVLWAEWAMGPRIALASTTHWRDKAPKATRHQRLS